MLRACFLQIPSGYYIQVMNSNLHLNDLLLPIGIMNVISILPILLLAPMIECVTTCLLSMAKKPLAPAKVISEHLYVHVPTYVHIILISSPEYPHVFLALLSHPPPFLSCNCAAAPISYYPTLFILPLQLWAMFVPLCPSWWLVCLSCRGRLTLLWSRPCLEKYCKCHPCHVSSSLFSTSYLVLQSLSSPLHVSNTLHHFSQCWPRGASYSNHIITNKMTHNKVVPFSCWLSPSQHSDTTSSSAGSLISFQLTPSHIRGISLHFLTLSYGGGCFLGAFIVLLVYFFSGGEMNTVLHIFCQT